ncbi:MAG: OmpA family protein [Spirochaetales bacterium]|nr:OmpA family protein [Spirochaetales bacterium]
MKKILYIAFFLPLATGLFAETFTFKFTKGEKYRIVATVQEKIYIQDKLESSRSFLDKISAEVTDDKAGTGSISALYQVSGREEYSEGSYTMEDETQASFTVDPQGRYTVPKGSLYPTTRNVPLFPKNVIRPGFSWSAPGIEVHDMRELFDIETPFVFPVNVQYKFAGFIEKEKKRLAEIEIEYSYGNSVTGIGSTDGTVSLVRIEGIHKMLYYWDPALGKPNSYEEVFDVKYTLSNSATVEFVGTAQSTVTVARPLDKQKAAEDINKEIEKNKLKDVHAEKADQGVKITLDDIQFQPDSDEIIPGEARKIEIISDILKKYPDRDIKVVGHTAAVGTPESCLELSIRRAKAVGDSLLKLGARRAEQMTIQGKGLTEPVAPNTTEAGRRKNRRVEILLLEN